jgi:hypothetical protein
MELHSFLKFIFSGIYSLLGSLFAINKIKLTSRNYLSIGYLWYAIGKIFGYCFHSINWISYGLAQTDLIKWLPLGPPSPQSLLQKSFLNKHVCFVLNSYFYSNNFLHEHFTGVNNSGQGNVTIQPTQNSGFIKKKLK